MKFVAVINDIVFHKKEKLVDYDNAFIVKYDENRRN
jgi:hypothetical protein